MPPSSAAVTKVGSVSPRSDFGFLRANADFQRVFKLGAKRRSGGITVVEAPGVSESGRIGIIATKKVGNAVARNRAKRRLREAVRAVGVPPGRDYVVIVSTSVVDAPFSTLLRWVERGLHQEQNMEEAGNG